MLTYQGTWQLLNHTSVIIETTILKIMMTWRRESSQTIETSSKNTCILLDEDAYVNQALDFHKHDH